MYGLIIALLFFTAEPVEFGTLLNEMHDLELLARLPEPAYTTVQFSSYDRRSVSPEAPEWYSNSDGFGGEPIPGFQAVLEEPGEDGVGFYLVADVQGPGAVVRGWSASMGGVMKAYLDGSDVPVFEGSGYDFMAQRARIWMEKAGLDANTGDAFRQQDADYLPVPFEKSLRVTWRGTIKELHFYALEVRLYEKGTPVTTFDPMTDLEANQEALAVAVERLTKPSCIHEGEVHEAMEDLDPDALWEWETEEKPGAITEFKVQLLGTDAEKVYRGCLLRMAFDGAHKPQVETPVGDFFGTAPGINVFNSLPMAVAADGTMTCRFVMPFRERAKITLLNATDEKVRLKASVRVSPWTWNDRSLYFRAKWRCANLLDQRFGAFDMPYVLARGRGNFVGAACMLANPSTVPHPYGSWWGEGDEKVFVDAEPFPSFYGTGSEDYYNYSWSRPDLFDHPYCGQPANTGPGNQGYCTNHRWHVLDAVPFRESFAFYMEVWPHNAKPGLSYACIAYLYARPGAIDDHRRVQLSELNVMPVPSMEPEAGWGSRNAVIFHFEDREMEVNGGAVGFDGTQLCASRNRLVSWKAEPGHRIAVPFDWEKEGEFCVNIVAAHWPDGGAVKVLLDGKPLNTDGLGGAELGRNGEEKVVMKSLQARRLLSTRFRAVPIQPGAHTLELECLEPGRFGFDYLWIQ